MAFKTTQIVRFADIDHAGIMYYPVYVHYMHLAFEDMFRSRFGDRWYAELLSERRIGFPTVKVEAEYKAPLRFGDAVETSITVEKLGRSSITLGYKMNHVDSQECCFVGKNTCVAVDLERFESLTLPEDLREFFESI